MVKDCRYSRLRLSKYADSQVNDRERSDIEAHLSNCPPCQELLASYRLVNDAIVAPAQLEVPPYMLTRIRQRMAAERRREPVGVLARFRPVLVPMGIAALLVVSVFLGLQVSQTINQSSRNVEIQAINLQPEDGGMPATQTEPGQQPAEDDTLYFEE